MQPKHRRPLFRMSHASHTMRQDRKEDLHRTDGTDGERNGGHAAEVMRIRLMKDALDQYWASRLANRGGKI
jgi:hypothetical protein